MYETTCDHCGCVLGEGEGFGFREACYCEDCLEELTVCCSHCGTRIDRDDNEDSREMPLCGSCCSRYYVFCERCGTLIRQEDAYYESDDDDTPYCDHCRRENETIHNHYYKPEPIFYGSGPRYFGVKLEVDGGGEDYELCWRKQTPRKSMFTASRMEVCIMALKLFHTRLVWRFNAEKCPGMQWDGWTDTMRKFKLQRVRF